jgi:hypothetical protein
MAIDSRLVGTCSRLATVLDVSMFLRNGVKRIYPPGTSLYSMIAAEPSGVLNLPELLGGRYLLRYLRAAVVGRVMTGTSDATYVTSTPYTPEESIAWLALPFTLQPRTHVVLLDPAQVTRPLPDGSPRRVFGPRWVQFGSGLEYILESGYPDTAIVSVSADPGKYVWELEVT